MLNRDFDCLTVNGACDLSVKNILAGSPLTLGANGYKLCGAGDKFAGLSFNYYFVGKDDVNGGEWFADSQEVAIVKIAQVTLQGDEIDGVKVYPFVHTDAFAVNDSLFVNAEGKLTKVAPTLESGADAKAVGTVIAWDANTAILVAYINTAI